MRPMARSLPNATMRLNRHPIASAFGAEPWLRSHGCRDPLAAVVQASLELVSTSGDGSHGLLHLEGARPDGGLRQP